jgi:hypothetical protein
MTSCVLDRVYKQPGRLGAMDLFEYVRIEVPAYIRDNFPGAQQTPVHGGKVEHPPFLRE